MGITNGNGNKTKLNLGLGMGMGMEINYWYWKGMGLKKIFPLISNRYVTFIFIPLYRFVFVLV